MGLMITSGHRVLPHYFTAIISNLPWNSVKFPYRTHCGPPSDPAMGHFSPFHTITLCFAKIRFNAIFHLHLVRSNILSRLGFSTCAVYILIMKANEGHNFSDLFDKVLYMFRTGPLSIIRSISTLYTRNRCLSC
jgi:hypothetical protein